MKKEKFVDLMGQIDNKFLEEAQEYIKTEEYEGEEKAVRPVIVTADTKKSARKNLFPIKAALSSAAALFLAVALGIAFNWGRAPYALTPDAPNTEDSITDSLEKTVTSETTFNSYVTENEESPNTEVTASETASNAEVTNDDVPGELEPFPPVYTLDPPPVPNSSLTWEQQQVEYCLYYLFENYGEFYDYKMDSNEQLWEHMKEHLSMYRILDLNFDGTKEIMISCKYYCPTYIFELGDASQNDSKPKFIDELKPYYKPEYGYPNDCITGYLESFDEIYPYENGDEKYFYLYNYEFDNYNRKYNIVKAIKYDKEKGYYFDEILTYVTAADKDDSVSFDFTFKNGKTEVSEDEFRKLWAKYDMLPPIELN